MDKSFFILIVLALCGLPLNHVAGQTTTSKTQSPTNSKSPKDPGNSAPVVMPATVRSIEAKRLYEEGMELVEAREFSPAAEKFQQAVQLDGEFADAYAALGRANFRLQQWGKAVANLRRAAELRTNQRTRDPLHHQKPSVEQREEARVPDKSVPAGAQIRLPQATNANAAGGKMLRPESETTRPEGQTVDPNATGKSATANPQSKPPLATNSNAASSKTLATNTLPAVQPADGGATSKSVPTSSQPKVPQATNANAGSANSLHPESVTERPAGQTVDANATGKSATANPPPKPPLATNSNASSKTLATNTLAPVQPADGGATSKNVPTSSQPKVPQATNANAESAKTLHPEAKTSRSPVGPINNATGKDGTASSQPKLPQATNGAAAGVTTLRPGAETTRLPVKSVEGGAGKNAPTGSQPNPASSAPKLPQATNANAADVKTVLLKSDDVNILDQKHEPAHSAVSMNFTPTPPPVETKSVSPPPAKASGADISLTRIYRVGPGDVLDVSLSDSQSTKSTLFTITSAGLLEHPSLTEPVEVTGLTAEEVAAKIEDDFNKRGLNDTAKVIVGVRDYGSHTILVSGLVKDPGTKILRREAIPLYVVVADAQPLPEAVSVKVVRNELNEVYDVDLTQTAEMNLLVRPGDVITLQPSLTQFVYIGGEVKFPGEMTFRRGLTLTQAIITAGGTPKCKLAQISRADGRGFLLETSFSLLDIRLGKTADPLIHAGDRIMILR